MTVYDLLNKYQMTVTTAESCTGGLVASGLVDIAGISAFFKEGYVTYAKVFDNFHHLIQKLTKIHLYFL